MRRGTALRAWHELAVLMHEPNVRRLQNRISFEQFEDWCTYMTMVPADRVQAQYHAAHICQTFVNMWRAEKTDPFPLEDFLIKFGDEVEGFFDPKSKEKPRQTADQIIAQLFEIVDGNNQVMRERTHG